MAYPTVSAPYGLKAVNSLDGKPYAGAIRQIPIAAGFATAIFNGDTVKISGGYLVADTATNNATPCGVLVGCSYVNSSGQPVQGQYYPAAVSTAANPAFAYVVDDQQALFKVALVTAGSTTIVSSTVGARSTLVGQNIALVQNVGSTTTGDSAIGATLTGAGTTATIPLRVIDVVPESAQVISGTTYYREVLVKLNTHQYNNTTGV